MGVDRTHYVVYGFKMDPITLKEKGVDVFNDVKYLPYTEGHQGISEIIVCDYMSWNYVVFGKLIHRSTSYEEPTLTMISYTDFFDSEENEYLIDTFKELFGVEVYEEMDEDPSVIIFTHCS